LEDADKYDGVIAGFIFNFREYENTTYFVPINEFIKYKYIAQNEISEHTYKSKVNKSSISLDICKEIGIEIKHYKKKVKYHYYIKQLLDELISRFQD
jgi:penicillin-binding protein-related factor A (putative recombinase)